MERFIRFGSSAMLSFVVLLGLTTPAFAQNTPKAELSAGYQLLRIADGEGFSETLSKGWYLDLAGNINGTFAIVGQVGGNSKTFDGGGGDVDLSLNNFMVGARVGSRRNPKVNPFGQFLVGGVRHKVTGPGFTDAGTDTAVQVGAGVNVTPGAVGFQIGVDYLRIISEGEGESLNGLRFALGIVVPFGR